MSITPAETRAHEELQAYTLGHGDPSFIHQHVVDAWAAQHADERSKPIGVAFALVGLYLHVDRGFAGREVQLAHMRMARRKREWPTFPLPADRGPVTAVTVMAEAPGAPGAARDATIDAWCASVWDAYREARDAVLALWDEFS